MVIHKILLDSNVVISILEVWKSPVRAVWHCTGFSLECIIATMTERIQIFIDGGNFYHLALMKIGLKDGQFDYDAFASFLANGRTISNKGKRLYIGTVREQEGNKNSVFAMSKQMAFFSYLKRSIIYRSVCGKYYCRQDY